MRFLLEAVASENHAEAILSPQFPYVANQQMPKKRKDTQSPSVEACAS